MSELPIQALFATPSPPLVEILPVLAEVASTVPSTKSDGSDKAPDRFRLVAETVPSVLVPATSKLFPIQTLLAIPTPPAVMMLPVNVLVASTVDEM